MVGRTTALSTSEVQRLLQGWNLLRPTLQQKPRWPVVPEPRFRQELG
jgi:hypothetical protein